MCFRGEELETPNLVLINFKNFFRDVYDAGDVMGDKKQFDINKEIKPIW